MERRSQAPRVLALAEVVMFLAVSAVYAWRVHIFNRVTSAKTVTEQQLKDAVYGPTGYYASLFKGVFYVGSDDHFDYIALMHGRSTVKVFKTRQGDMSIEHRMKIAADEKRWVDITWAFPVPQ